MLLLEGVKKGANNTEAGGRILADLTRELGVIESQVCGQSDSIHTGILYCGLRGTIRPVALSLNFKAWLVMTVTPTSTHRHAETLKPQVISLFH